MITTTTNQKISHLSRGHTRFEGLGWKIRLQQKRRSFFLTLAKEIVVGNGLRKGDDVFYYLVDVDGRKGVLIFLDGKERPDDNLVRVKGTSFLIKK